MHPEEAQKSSGKFTADRRPAADAWSVAPRPPERNVVAAPSREPKPAASAGRDVKSILRARAKVLARESEGDAASDVLELVEFRLADELYAIESTEVREVYPLKDLTPLPCTPPFVLGIINVRGQIFTVVDLRRFFELPINGLTDLNKVIILRSDEMQVGILADSIVGIRTVPLERLQPSLPTLTGVRADYLRGVTDGRVIVLDTHSILADGRIVVHEEVEA